MLETHCPPALHVGTASLAKSVGSVASSIAGAEAASPTAREGRNPFNNDILEAHSFPLAVPEGPSPFRHLALSLGETWK